MLSQLSYFILLIREFESICLYMWFVLLGTMLNVVEIKIGSKKEDVKVEDMDSMSIPPGGCTYARQIEMKS